MKFSSTLIGVLIVGSAFGLSGGTSVYANSESDKSGASHGADDSLGRATAGDQSTPAALIEQMSHALKTLNYEGQFVHVQGSHITSMHILHSSDEHGQLERLTSLDGEAREVVRNNAEVTCIWPASKSVVVSQSKPRDLIPQIDADLANNQRYTFSFGKSDRVAGIATHVVNVMPRDQYRYGYRFWIDKDTNMLLRSMLLDGPNKPVEQVLFTKIGYPVSIDQARFDVSASEDQVTWLEPKAASATSGLPKVLEKQTDRVGFRSLPDGYVELSETYSPMPINDGPISHVMVSDGMASVSVYIEYVPTSEQEQHTPGLSSMGAMNAFGLSLPNAFITAVGEVPSDTVKAIASAVTLRGE